MSLSEEKKHTGETARLIKTSTIDVEGMNKKNMTVIDQKQSFYYRKCERP